MAGMEELEVHSKSYLVRWIRVKEEHTISWSIQPHKKSLNFGIFKHPGHSVTANVPGSGSHSTDVSESNPSSGSTGARQNASMPVIEKLTGIGLKPIKWIGKCEADKISQGTYDVPRNEGGNYALVVDNTFSKQTSKTATLVLLTYPTAVPPQSGHQGIRYNPAGAAPTPADPEAASNNTRGASYLDVAKPGDASRQARGRRRSLVAKSVNSSSNGGSTKGLPSSSELSGDSPTTVHTGILQKRRRKRHQGWARRYFSLDFGSSTLSYYHDRNSSALRGAIPLALAAIAANEKTREISVDSGAEVWHLRASNDQDFVSWKRALEKASKTPADDTQQNDVIRRIPSLRIAPNALEEREWMQIERLVGHVAGSRDAVRQLAKDTDPKYLPPQTASPSERPRERSPSPSSRLSPNAAEATNGDDHFDSRDRRPFWKRKASFNSYSGSKRGPVSPQLTIPGQFSDVASITGDRKPSSISSHADGSEDIHDRLMAVLRDLDSVVAEFGTLFAERKERFHPPTLSAHSRRSIDSDMSQEFFDAKDGAMSPILTIRDSDDENEVKQAETVADYVSSDSDGEDLERSISNTLQNENALSLFPVKPRSLAPLPLSTVVKRRTTVLAPTLMPPSLIGFLRRNVGKDLSQISMPVSANEPLSLLQRAAELMEYSVLLDKASTSTDSVERLIYVTAFAVSSLSNYRVRERAIRKPFNPMLGETFELIREDRGFRFIAEKVSHRPVQLAYVAESKDWSITQSPMPTQKFWGKSAEIITEGIIRLTLHTTGEHFSWSPATCFLRNIIAGEKYVEPTGELLVFNETTGQKAVSTFKAGGMFSGRSEDVTSKAFDPYGKELPLGMVGTWTTSLQLVKNGSLTDTVIWSVGPLVPDAPKHYGLTSFAATLNELTPIEGKKLPPTDSRLRPDQRALENGDVDRAEEEKTRLEENQRARRREMEAAGESWVPRWFTRVEDAATAGTGTEIVWRLKTGKDGYWEERAKGTWTGVTPVF